MIGYTFLGTNQLDRAREFYAAFLGELGATVQFQTARATLYGREAGQPMFGICTPYDERPASVGNGCMIALPADSREQVQQLHALALSLGASDDGAPGERLLGFYMAYFRDLDGNKLALFHQG